MYVENLHNARYVPGTPEGSSNTTVNKHDFWTQGAYIIVYTLKDQIQRGVTTKSCAKTY